MSQLLLLNATIIKINFYHGVNGQGILVRSLIVSNQVILNHSLLLIIKGLIIRLRF